MNKVIIIGRATKDFECRMSGETNIARGSVAVDRRFKREGEQSADFINVVGFGRTADFLEKYGRKGTKFAIEGRIQTGSYKNRDGQNVYTTDVVIENVEFAESKQTQAQAAPIPSPSGSDFLSITEEELESLPFN